MFRTEAPTAMTKAAEQPFAGSLPAVISASQLALTCRSSRGSGLVPPNSLTLRELEALTSALLPVFLALLHPRIARQKSICPQRWPQFRIEPRNGARQSHAHRAGLPAHAAAVGGYHHVHLFRQACEFERFDGVMLPRVIREVLLHRSSVYREL